MRQRAGEVTVLATAIYLVLACIPLNLPSRDWIESAFSRREASFQSRKQADSIQLQAKTDPLRNVEPISDTENPEPTSNLSPDHKVTKQADGERHKKTHDVLRHSTMKTDGTLVEATKGFTNRSDSPVDLSRSHSEVKSEIDDGKSLSLQLWQRSLPSIYFLGVVLCIGWLLLGKTCLFLFLKKTEKPAEEITELFESICSPHLSYTPRLFVSRNRWSAFSFGLFRSTIIVPESLCHESNREYLRTVLLHEIAHIVRGDALSRMLLNVAFPLLYFHPCYWWVRREVNFSSELIADDWAANFSTPLKYAGELTSMKRLISRTIPILFGSSNFFSSRHDFTRRITMLIRRKTPLELKLSTSRKISIYGSFSLLLCGLVFTTGARNFAAVETVTTTDNNPFGAQKNNFTKKSNLPPTTKKVHISRKSKNDSRSVGSSNKFTNANTFQSKKPKSAAQNPKPSVQTATGGSSKGRPVELLQLATQYANATEATALASSQLEKMIAANKKRPGTISNIELQRRESQLKASKRKQKLFYTITQAELELTQSDFVIAELQFQGMKNLFHSGVVTKIEYQKQKREIIRLKIREHILETILGLK